MVRITKTNLPTIADVAARAGVSIATVSRVINSTNLVSEETSARVFQAVQELDYQPHAAARSLASRRTKTIGLILTEIGGNFFSPLLRGIEAVTREAGYDLLILSTQGQAHTDRNHPLPLSSRNTDGLLVFANTLNETELRRQHALGFPIILLHQTPPEGVEIPCVTVENKDGACKIISHLIEIHGRRRIAFLAGPPGAEDSSWREMGYREALAQHDIPVDENLILQGSFNQVSARQAIHQILSMSLECDAIFAADDESAIGALSALREAGLRVPEDIALVGFDDMDVSQYLTPPLTTVRAPTEQVGVQAARQLIHLIQSGEADSLTLLPTEVIVRHSCGC
jgi:DNA-binding LacI/PurR family transcriptional regulator